jgi:L-2-hydroxyglutarate oxidase
MSGTNRVAVVGGGIVGLAVARAFTQRYPGIEVEVFEKEDDLAHHQSGHNSGVLHAGIYYQPGSLKATLCRRGGEMLREFCQEHEIALRELGKLIVATSPPELAGLVDLERRAAANAVPDVRRLSAAEIVEIEPAASGVAALHSPHTAAVDYVAVCAALATEIRSRGGTVRIGTAVDRLIQTNGGVGVLTREDRITFDRVVVCAGLTGDSLAVAAQPASDVRIVPFRGEYFALAESARHLVRGMIYPVPDPRYPFLGVHLTRDVHDHVHVGPNAVLALAREGYRRRDVRVRDLAEIVCWPGTRKLVRAHWRSGMGELASSLSKRRYLGRVRTYLPALTAADLQRAPAGVRAQAVRRNGELVDDFALETVGRIVFVRNAPSPAATSSLAIAEHIVQTMSR